MSASEKVKRVVWARAAGRCTICNKDLLSDHLGSNTVVRSIGEVAHIAAESMIGPRGDSTVEPEDRNEADNLMLLCPNEHTEADSGRLTDPIYTLDYLRRRKEIKEAWIKFVTGLDEDRRTTILRVSGDVRGAHGMISQTDAASIVMNESLRTPWYLPDPRGSGLTVDLTGIPGPGTPSYWSSCVAQIEAEIARLHMSAKDGSTTHVSVFGFARLPRGAGCFPTSFNSRRFRSMRSQGLQTCSTNSTRRTLTTFTWFRRWRNRSSNSSPTARSIISISTHRFTTMRAKQCDSSSSD